MIKRRRWMLVLLVVSLVVGGIIFYDPPGPAGVQPQDPQPLVAMKWIFRGVTFLYVCLIVVLPVVFVRHVLKSVKFGQPLPSKEERDEEDRSREL